MFQIYPFNSLTGVLGNGYDPPSTAAQAIPWDGRPPSRACQAPKYRLHMATGKPKHESVSVCSPRIARYLGPAQYQVRLFFSVLAPEH